MAGEPEPSIPEILGKAARHGARVEVIRTQRVRCGQCYALLGNGSDHRDDCPIRNVKIVPDIDPEES